MLRGLRPIYVMRLYEAPVHAARIASKTFFLSFIL